MIQLFSAKSGQEIEVENLGINRIKAYLINKNEQVDVTYLNIFEKASNNFDKINIDCKIFGFSMYNDTIDHFMEIIKEIKRKKPEAIVVVGSKFVTLYYKEILDKFDEIDLTILGDGEKTIHELIECVKNGQSINDFISKHSGVASKLHFKHKYPMAININELPWPDRTWMEDQEVHFALICDSHGCVSNCSFCTWNSYCSAWNGRPAKDIYEEITDINSKYGVKFFYFTSSSFEDPGKKGKERIRELCKYLTENNKNFTFRCYLRADSFSDTTEDKELLKLMRASGFRLVTIGIESGNEEDLEIYNKIATVKQNKFILEILNEMDIEAKSIGFIMFNPYSTLDKLKLNYLFLSEFKSGSIQKYVTKLRIFKQTKIYEKAKNDDLISNDGYFYQSEGCKYHFKSAEIEAIDNFAREYLETHEIKKLNRELEVSYDAILSFCDFIDNGEFYKNTLLEIYNRNAELLRVYFYNLYVNVDLVKCKSLLPEMLKVYSDNIKELRLLRFNFYRKLNKQTRFDQRLSSY